MMQNAKGFTLVELMIVVTLIAAISAVAVPNIVVWRQNAQLSAAARDLYSDFQLAKITAIESNQYCSMTFNQSPAGYLIYKENTLPYCQYDTGDEIIKNVALSNYGATRFDTSQGGGDGLTFSSPANAIAFAPDGLPKNNTGGFGAGTVYLKNDRDKKIRVIVSSAGNIRITLD
jgi:type IV fimbrial biogenesis protein FimT